MLKPFISILVFSLAISLAAQNSDLKFENITTVDGLSTSWVRAIYEDSDGFIWFGTSDGLNRFDAYSTRIYRPEDDTSNHLINGAITHILGLKGDELLICTEQGVNIFNLQTEEFSPFPLLDNVRLTHAQVDGKGKIWFTSYSGLYCYSIADSSLRVYRHDPMNEESLSNNQLNSCYIDRKGNLWIATNVGLDRFDRDTETFHHILGGSDPRIQYQVNSIIEDDYSQLWVGIANRGLALLVPNNDPLSEGEFIDIVDGSVSSLIIDNQNVLWIGNDLGIGIHRLQLKEFDKHSKFSISHCQGIPGEFLGLSDNTISTIYEDHQGGIWIGTFAGGVFYHSPLMKQFHVVNHLPGNTKSLSNNVINCLVDDKDILWVGTENGLCRMDKETNEFTNFFNQPNDPKSLGANGVISLLKDRRGNLWVGTWSGGLNYFNEGTQNFTRFLSDQTKEGTLSNNNVFALCEDSRGNLWVGTNGGGLNLFNYRTGKFKVFMPDPNDPTSLYHNAVNDICETSDGQLFISVNHSLELFDYETQTFSHYLHNKEDSTSIGPGRIIDVFEDSRKNLWVATSSGLNLFNSKSGFFQRYTNKNGLPGNTIHSIIEDNSGNLWLGTNNGISKFLHAIHLPETPVFINYTVEDGLMGNEFVRRSVMRSPDGRLYFGGYKGYVFFDPRNVLENPVPPKVVLTDFRIFGGSKETDDTYDFLDKEINHVEKIVLNYNQSDFVIRFAVLNYLNPKKNKYSYILEGYENDWHKVGYERIATYTNINPGKYTFRVRGSNNDGVWSVNDKSIKIIIKPAWWGTLVFKLLVALVVLFLLYIIIRFRIQIYERQKILLEDMVKERTTELSELNAVLEEKQEEISIQNEELTKHRTNLEKLVTDRTDAMKHALKRAEEADRLKSAFLANMSHEIRTPMNAIVGFATLLTNDGLLDDERSEYLEIINNNSETLMVLINDILEISLIEANQLRLKKTTFNVTTILEELYSFYKLRNRQEIDLVFVNKNDSKDLYLNSDQTRFRQILTNLLNNAFKYTESGEISFGYELQDQEVKFFVTDSGIGIAETEYDNIFNYFHKIDKGDNKLYRGAGIGLSISNKLVELMGGKIWLDSSVGKGTSFFFTLPPENGIDVEKHIETSGSERRNNLKGITVIVAEDDTNNFKLIEKIIKPTKATIIWAENGKVAVAKVNALESTKNCIVLMDIKMPLLNGINATKLIKKTHPELPVIAVTAYAQPNDKDQILKQNFIDYIAKPLKPDQLLLKIFKYAFINQ